MSRLTKDAPIDALNRRVVARELDVAEIRAHLAASTGAVEPGEVDVVGMLLFTTASFADLKAMSDITDEELAKLAPSEIKTIIAACREVNADFFGMMGRLQKLA